MTGLVKPCIRISDEIIGFRRAFLERDEWMNGASGLAQFKKTDEWLAHLARNENPATMEAGRVPQEVFAYIYEDKLVGFIALRTVLSEYLEKYGGHIAYCVHPEHRRKGHATRMLRRCLEKARDKGMTKVLITCEDGNEGSRRTILACGGVYEGAIYEPQDQISIQRYWIDL